MQQRCAKVGLYQQVNYWDVRERNGTTHHNITLSLRGSSLVIKEYKEVCNLLISVLLILSNRRQLRGQQCSYTLATGGLTTTYISTMQVYKYMCVKVTMVRKQSRAISLWLYLGVWQGGR